MSRTFVDNAMEIDGMTSAEALALMDIFIKRAIDSAESHRLIEFGAYKGRTASILAQNLDNTGHLDILEQADYLEIDKIKAISNNVTWHKEKSEDFCAKRLSDDDGGRPIAASHHDASHFFVNVKTELEYVAAHSSKGSVLILDDFNDTYAQVRAAFYYLRFAQQFPFEILLIGFNKCILVHSDRFRENESFVLDRLLDEMESQYGFVCRLARTDNHEQSRGFFLARRPPNDTERFYGRSFFGDRFYKQA
jgi:hypothetical protein